MELEKAKKILNEQNGMKYSDEEIIEIIKILEVFTKVEVNYLLNKKTHEKCNPLRKGINR
ncbi:MAG: hypothetical protein EBR38_09020 [Flavobacteriaceae bacterium]|jgi:hypothetical protein|nr:hypothetical protein [Flavobacteriaceae bacterium]